jgi:hypothetical protein
MIFRHCSMSISTFARPLMMALLAVGIAFPAAAQAKCKQKDVKGTWYAQIFFVDSTVNEGFWLNCKFKLNSKGVFDVGSSQCQLDSGEIYTTEGQFTINKTCQVDPVTITYYDATPAIVGTSILNFGMLDRGKSVMHGLGDSGTNEPFMFSAVKG